jgi:uncharacterized membrane protein YcaP (DUF421 family)
MGIAASETMTEPGLWGIAGRTGLVYLSMLVVIRVLGKRTVGNLTAFDMIIALVMGDSPAPPSTARCP